MLVKFPLWISICCCLGIAGCRYDVQPVSEKGVSRELAEYRKARIKDLAYQLYFDIPELKTEQVEGQVKIDFRLDEPEQVIFDFREPAEPVKKVEVNGESIPINVGNEHILVSEKYLQKGKNKVVITFIAGNQSLNRNEDYLYTLLVPDRARTLFPCFDQPDLKACFTLKLEVPEAWEAVANGSIEQEKVLDGRKSIAFKKTQPLSTYLFSFVAGRWSKKTETCGERTISLYHRETDPDKLGQIEVIFDQVFAALAWMEEYTGVPYPFEKYDLILVPGFQFGGMEHAGAVLYNDKRMFLSGRPTVEEELGRMELIAHETAHMWFGDYVTMAWFDDVWTKEVFANYFATRMTEPRFPQINHRLNALRSFYPASYSEDRTQGTNAIRQPLDNLNSAGLIYGQIVYNKAPVVLLKLAELMGEENFREGIQEYLQTYAYSNATWDGLIGILDRYTTEDLTVWSRAWVDEKGMPEIVIENKEGRIAVRQNDPWGRKLIWPQELNYVVLRKPMDGRSSYDSETIRVSLKDSVVGLDILPGQDYIIPNVDGTGYGFFKMDSATIGYCLAHLSDFTNPVTRLSVIISLNENRLNGLIASAIFTRVILNHLKTEPEALIYTTALGYVKDACYRHQMGRNPETERALLELARRGKQAGFQQSAFRALLEVWTLPEITREIYQIWAGNQPWDGLELNERDKMKMAYELAVRMPEKYDFLLEQQSKRITNPDRKREFRFVAQAVHPDGSYRDSLFQSFLIPSNRRMEPWVAQALYYLNHPLREQSALKYIRPALENLEDVQQTGDIFFPKNWILSCLRGHNSVEAAQIVLQFLQEYPDYPQLLKNKILQSADHLICSE